LTTERFEKQNLGRNDPCPVCGKKMKHCRGHAGWKRVRTIGLLLGAGIMCVFAFFIWWLLGNGFRQPSSPWQIERLQRMIVEYSSGHPAEQWWFTTSPRPEDGLTETNAKCLEIEQLLQKLVQQYRDVTPLTREIARNFTRFYVTLYQGGTISWRYPGIDPLSLRQTEPHGLLVIFVPRDKMQMLPLGVGYEAMQYVPDWRAVVVLGHAWPDSVLAGSFYHELSHALRDSRQPSDSDLRIDEESEMNWLEAEVINAVSGGKLFAYLDSIIQRQSDHSSYQSVILSLTADDLRQYYAYLGLLRPTKEIDNALVATYLIMLGQRLIRTTRPEVVWAAQERELYRWITRHLLKY